MANISARWHGDNYQSRHFWIRASWLLDEQRPEVAEVTFEADGPKSFDDIVVRYSPGRRNAGGPERITAEHYQIKWHTDDAGHFGYADLIEPEFIGAKTVSVLQRLKEAKAKCEPHSAFYFVTTYNLTPGDPLTALVYGRDHSLLLNRLFDGTKTDKSRMGEVRKLWREHLELASDDELRDVLEGFHIEHGASSLDRLRDEVALHFRIVRLQGRDAETTFIYDEAARVLVGKKINRLDRATLRKFCEEEGYFIPVDMPAKRGVSIQSYEPRALSADIALAASENTLFLRDHFDTRHLRAGETWDGVRDKVRAFLAKELARGPDIRLFLEAQTSIAFLSGTCLGTKSGASVEIVQTGFGNAKQVWDPNDRRGGPKPLVDEIPIGDGRDIALVLSLTRNALPKVRQFVATSLPSVGEILHVTPEGGPDLRSVRGGEHALTIAHHVSEVVSNRVQPGACVHIFLAAPNALSFYLGQISDEMGPRILYEFDFKKEVDGSYTKSFAV